MKNSNNKTFIVHIIHRLGVGGLENGLVNLINALPENEFSNAIICLDNATEFRTRIHRQDVQVFEMNKREGKDFAMYWKLWRLLRHLEPDIVHTRNLGTIDCSIVALLAGVRARVHGEHGWDIVDLHGTKRKYRFLRRICRYIVNRYVAVSRDLQKYLETEIGISRLRIQQIYNGVDTTRFSVAQRTTREGVFTIGTIGRMEPVKNPLSLARAFVMLAHRSRLKDMKLRLVMVGDGSLREAVENIFHAECLNAEVVLTGMRDDVNVLLQKFDVFVLPSLNEGISNTILEAMATGLPVVAANVGGNPELVKDGETGFLVPPGDPEALVNILEIYMRDPELARCHGQRARKSVEAKFSMNSMISSYEQLYREVCQKQTVTVEGAR